MGAAIAAGNHEENGIWADFVIAATIKVKEIINLKLLEFIKFIVDQFPIFIIMAIEMRIRTSPTRFINAVIIPAANDFGFW